MVQKCFWLRLRHQIERDGKLLNWQTLVGLCPFAEPQTDQNNNEWDDDDDHHHDDYDNDDDHDDDDDHHHQDDDDNLCPLAHHRQIKTTMSGILFLTFSSNPPTPWIQTLCRFYQTILFKCAWKLNYIIPIIRNPSRWGSEYSLAKGMPGKIWCWRKMQNIDDTLGLSLTERFGPLRMNVL